LAAGRFIRGLSKGGDGGLIRIAVISVFLTMKSEDLISNQ